MDHNRIIILISILTVNLLDIETMRLLILIFGNSYNKDMEERKSKGFIHQMGELKINYKLLKFNSLTVH